MMNTTSITICLGKMNGLNASYGISKTITASFEVNLPSFHDCQSQMIAMIIATGKFISLAIIT